MQSATQKFLKENQLAVARWDDDNSTCIGLQIADRRLLMESVDKKVLNMLIAERLGSMPVNQIEELLGEDYCLVRV